METLTYSQQLEYLARSYYILAITTGQLHYMIKYKELMKRLVESQQSEVKQCA